LIVVHLVPGIQIDNWKVALLASLVLGLVNAFLRPVLLMLTLFLNILSFGLFTLVINGFLFYMVSKVVPGFKVIDFWSAFWGALFFSLISFILSIFFTSQGKIQTRSFSRNSCAKSKHSNVIDVEGKVEK
ncbi:MAG: phage holin family protein, partial [Candidatus Omnitrophica bacterium]|nr:phage holin family protein [Candidatus Omnitrophota bacterium]